MMRDPLRKSVRFHLQTHQRALPSALDPVFEVAAVFVDGVFDGPGGSVAEAADGRAGDDADAVGDFQQQVDVAQLAAAVEDAFEDFRHPGGTLAAGSALAAALVRVEPATVVEHLDDVGLVIDDDHRRSAQA